MQKPDETKVPHILELTKKQRQLFIQQLLFKVNAKEAFEKISKEFFAEGDDGDEYRSLHSAILYLLSTHSFLLDILTIMINPTKEELRLASKKITATQIIVSVPDSLQPH